MLLHHRIAAVFRLTRRKLRHLWLSYGFFWVGALLVGLLAVLFAHWTNDAQAQFSRWIAGREWLALLITPALTALSVWLTRKYFDGSGIPQVIAALHAPGRHLLVPQLFGLRIIIGKIGIGLMGMLGGLTIGREGPTVHMGASVMYEMRRFIGAPARALNATCCWRGQLQDCPARSILRWRVLCLRSRR